MLTYRKDIDGMRAIAVVAVILFHLGFFPNGYLGVDIFFVISGFLITQIIYKETLNGNFTISNFYMRRIRRILPLVMVVCFVALILAYFVMLPDDMENLAQSVIATNLFSNNILLLITSKNYWNVINEYKPLMHTWSLGVEEQFYVVFPLIFLLLKGKWIKYILPVIIGLTLVSLILFFVQPRIEPKFYLIQYRFFELAIGGIAAIYLRDQKVDARIKPFLLLLILFILFFGSIMTPEIRILLTVLATVGILLPSGSNAFVKLLLENPVSVYLGKISFSLYMWHQIYLAFGRYFVFEHIDPINAVIVGVLIVLTSALSYEFVEQPFRDKKKSSTKLVLVFTGSLFLINSLFAFYIYKINGVVRDVPELGLSGKTSYVGNLNFSYVDRVYKLDKPFSSSNKKKILVIGDSYARDWSNVLLESSLADQIELSFVPTPSRCKDIQTRLASAEHIFLCYAARSGDSVSFKADPRADFHDLVNNYKADSSKIYRAGIKNFGPNMGIYYNRRGRADYCSQRGRPDKYVLRANAILSNVWKERYIDLIAPVINAEGTVPVFTDDCKLFSQDTDHLTQFGAKQYAKLLDGTIRSIIK